jgi:hypothetical protein
MKKNTLKSVVLLVFILLLWFFPLMARADQFYCIPLDSSKGYICNPVDFELRTFNGETSTEQTGSLITITSGHKFRCYKKGDKWECAPFDKGAVLLENQHDCNCDNSNWYRLN